MADADASALAKALISKNKARQQEALNAFLVAAESLSQKGQIIEAELRFKQALQTAEKAFGKDSDQAMLVLSILAAFYHVHKRTWEARQAECRLESWQMQQAAPGPDETALQGALGQQMSAKKKEGMTRGDPAVAMSVTPEIRKACQILGLSPDKPLTAQEINRAWKRQMLDTNAHPDLGGNTDEAVILNKAKEALLAYLDLRAPKLGSSLKKKK
ncbi:MAG TPA: hypothetical protein V6C81_20740 [Planktothrix sp.]|jgi:hypothetical protein